MEALQAGPQSRSYKCRVSAVAARAGCILSGSYDGTVKAWHGEGTSYDDSLTRHSTMMRQTHHKGLLC